jgi:hypothetical protein
VTPSSPNVTVLAAAEPSMSSISFTTVVLAMNRVYRQLYRSPTRLEDGSADCLRMNCEIATKSALAARSRQPGSRYFRRPRAERMLT